MDGGSLEVLFAELNRAQARYLVAGGLAVVAHGFVRFTADVDLILDFEPASLTASLAVLEHLGYRPRPPVALAEFASPAARAAWVREKNLKVLSLWSERYPLTEVDLFVEPPLEFATAHARAHRAEIAAGIEITILALADLVDLKLRAGRPRDIEDVRQLRRLQGSDDET